MKDYIAIAGYEFSHDALEKVIDELVSNNVLRSLGIHYCDYCGVYVTEDEMVEGKPYCIECANG